VLKAVRDDVTPPNTQQLCMHMVSVWHVMSLLIGIISFEGHCLADYELVLDGGRRPFPGYLSLWKLKRSNLEVEMRLQETKVLGFPGGR
jgi:hypothetical protein